MPLADLQRFVPVLGASEALFRERARLLTSRCEQHGARVYFDLTHEVQELRRMIDVRERL